MSTGQYWAGLKWWPLLAAWLHLPPRSPCCCWCGRLAAAVLKLWPLRAAWELLRELWELGEHCCGSCGSTAVGAVGALGISGQH